MKIKAIRNEITESEALIYIGNKDLQRTNERIKIGEIKEVWFIVVSKPFKHSEKSFDLGSISYADENGFTEFSIYFEIIDNSIPENWIIIEPTRPWPEIKLIIGPRELFENDPQQMLNDIIGQEGDFKKFYDYVIKTKKARGENPWTVLKENIQP